jgi:arylsulfatase A-like enzyme
MITWLDSYVGRMLDRLKAPGLDSRTLVIFTSDNGPHDASPDRPRSRCGTRLFQAGDQPARGSTEPRRAFSPAP